MGWNSLMKQWDWLGDLIDFFELYSGYGGPALRRRWPNACPVRCFSSLSLSYSRE